LMDFLFSDLIGRGKNYLNDILVDSGTVQEHEEVLEEIFRRFDHYNLNFHPRKSALFKKTTTFFGHHISAEGITPEENKVAAAQGHPTSQRA